MPEELSNGTYLNEANIYIGKITPPTVVKLFQEQFQKEFKLFLTLRYKELVGGGRMVLTFLGRKTEAMLLHGEVDSMWELLSKALQSLVQKVSKFSFWEYVDHSKDFHDYSFIIELKHSIV